MKKQAIITYILAFALFLSACVYVPQGEGTSSPSTQGTESTPSSSDTSPSFAETETTPETEQFAVVSVGTEDYRVGPYDYREITLIINGEIISGMTLYHCVEEVEEVVIPEEVNGLPVIAIGDNRYGVAVFYSQNIKSDMIPETVCFIGMSVFMGCTELTNLTIPSSVKWIVDNAFGCSGLKEIVITPDMNVGLVSFWYTPELTKVVLQEGVTSFPRLNGCESLTEITIPSTITHLGLDESDEFGLYFYDTAITFLEIPEGVTFMCGNLLSGSIIESIILPTTLTDYEDSTFMNCPLKEIFFRGTEEQCPQGLIHIFETLEIPLYYLSETEPTEEGSYWHYVDGKPVIW